MMERVRRDGTFRLAGTGAQQLEDGQENQGMSGTDGADTMCSAGSRRVRDFSSRAMTVARRAGRRFRCAAWLLVVSVLLSPQVVWAQAETEPKQARWVTAYALVGLCIGVSLYSICRPSARRKASG